MQQLLASPPPVEEIRHSPTLHAWRQGDVKWRLVDDSFTFGYITYAVTRKRFSDLSGLKQWRVSVYVKATIKLRIGYGKKYLTFTVEDRGGEITHLRKLLAWHAKENWLYDEVRRQLEYHVIGKNLIADRERTDIWLNSFVGDDYHLDSQRYISKIMDRLGIDGELVL